MRRDAYLPVVALVSAAVVGVVEVGYYISHRYAPGVSPHLIALSVAVALLGVDRLWQTSHSPSCEQGDLKAFACKAGIVLACVLTLVVLLYVWPGFAVSKGASRLHNPLAQPPTLRLPKPY